ncbi:MAG: PhoPQ-activated pathogenicity-related family protein [Pirellulaceae bacterium]
MEIRLRTVVYLSLTAWSFFCADHLVTAQDLPAMTDLDRYVHHDDGAYQWKVVSNQTGDTFSTAVIDMTSQKWLTEDKVNRTHWQHWITIAYPKKVRTNKAFLMIGGGSNRPNPPGAPDDMIVKIAEATGSVVAELKMVPNQPLIFHNDGKPRVEDDLIGYTWDQYIKTGDSSWLARNAMVKSAVKAMDTITAFMASETGGQQKVDQFVVAGGSKRGWTTWLTGAVDSRVVAICPIVIDVLNVHESMRHHFAVYGFWAPAVGNYVQHRIMERLEDPRLTDLYKLVDPYYYRHRLTIPKFVVNAAGDQFFLPDSSQFYWDDLKGPKYLRYVPNADHGLDGSDAIESIIAFYSLALTNQAGPEFSWTNEADGSIRVTTKTKPAEVRLWQATNPDARDFRLETLGPKYTSQVIEASEPGVYVGQVHDPEIGWTAYFLELTFDVGAPVPLKLTTNVRVTPNVVPFAEKNPSLPTSLTVAAKAKDQPSAEAVIELVRQAFAVQGIDGDELICRQDGEKCYFNWCPDVSEFEETAGALTKLLKDNGCQSISYQLESGRNVTTDAVDAVAVPGGN